MTIGLKIFLQNIMDEPWRYKLARKALHTDDICPFDLYDPPMARAHGLLPKRDTREDIIDTISEKR